MTFTESKRYFIAGSAAALLGLTFQGCGDNNTSSLMAHVERCAKLNMVEDHLLCEPFYKCVGTSNLQKCYDDEKCYDDLLEELEDEHCLHDPPAEADWCLYPDSIVPAYTLGKDGSTVDFLHFDIIEIGHRPINSFQAAKEFAGHLRASKIKCDGFIEKSAFSGDQQDSHLNELLGKFTFVKRKEKLTGFKLTGQSMPGFKYVRVPLTGVEEQIDSATKLAICKQQMYPDGTFGIGDVHPHDDTSVDPAQPSKIKPHPHTGTGSSSGSNSGSGGSISPGGLRPGGPDPSSGSGKPKPQPPPVKPDQIGGIRNTGNTCFAASTMQLIRTMDLLPLLRDKCPSVAETSHNVCGVLINTLEAMETSLITLNDLFKEIDKACETKTTFYPPLRQQDGHELFQALFPVIDRELIWQHKLADRPFNFNNFEVDFDMKSKNAYEITKNPWDRSRFKDSDGVITVSKPFGPSEAHYRTGFRVNYILPNPKVTATREDEPRFQDLGDFNGDVRAFAEKYMQIDDGALPNGLDRNDIWVPIDYSFAAFTTMNVPDDVEEPLRGGAGKMIQAIYWLNEDGVQDQAFAVGELDAFKVKIQELQAANVKEFAIRLVNTSVRGWLQLKADATDFRHFGVFHPKGIISEKIAEIDGAPFTEESAKQAFKVTKEGLRVDSGLIIDGQQKCRAGALVYHPTEQRSIKDVSEFLKEYKDQDSIRFFIDKSSKDFSRPLHSIDEFVALYTGKTTLRLKWNEDNKFRRKYWTKITDLDSLQAAWKTHRCDRDNCVLFQETVKISKYGASKFNKSLTSEGLTTAWGGKSYEGLIVSSISHDGKPVLVTSLDSLAQIWRDQDCHIRVRCGTVMPFELSIWPFAFQYTNHGLCTKCNHAHERKTESLPILPLSLPQITTARKQFTLNLPEAFKTWRDFGGAPVSDDEYTLMDYKCEARCNGDENTKFRRVSDSFEDKSMLMFQIKVFAFDPRYPDQLATKQTQKDFEFRLPDEVVLNGKTYKITGVQYHEGKTPNSGHYEAVTLRKLQKFGEKIKGDKILNSSAEWTHWSDSSLNPRAWSVDKVEQLKHDTFLSPRTPTSTYVPYLVLYRLKEDVDKVPSHSIK